MLKVVTCLVVSLMLAATLVLSRRAAAQLLAEAKHQDWESFINVHGVAFAVTERDVQALRMGLSFRVTRETEHCDTVFLSVLIIAPSLVPHVTEAEEKFGSLQIDTLPLHRFTFQAEHDRSGSFDVAHLVIAQVAGKQSIVEELLKGRLAKVTFEFQPNRPVSITFSLGGSASAIARSQILCERAAAQSAPAQQPLTPALLRR